MLKLARGITQLNIWIGKICAWLIVPMFLALIADVIMRYVVGSVTIWTAELAQLIFGVYSVIAGGYLLVNRGHVNVDILYGRFSKKRKAVVDLATSFLFVFFMLVLIWQSADMAWESIEKMETSYSVWNPYIWPVKLAVPVAGILLFLQGIVRMVSDWRAIKGLENDPDVWGKQAADGPAH
ncbi:MAG: TRAP transporter small permease subunit [Burkholderiaceae bacterium]|jgi:TRAP-type mannitol/chloroaromatic compound transport system permease small subunit|nr:TRAP transporter small permease subunit [Burkholderiaceae bacterium]MEB2319420.1 TRAP transporter small permease subunit [Pseudomonadota bacterium]